MTETNLWWMNNPAASYWVSTRIWFWLFAASSGELDPLEIKLASVCSVFSRQGCYDYIYYHTNRFSCPDVSIFGLAKSQGCQQVQRGDGSRKASIGRWSVGGRTTSLGAFSTRTSASMSYTSDPQSDTDEVGLWRAHAAACLLTDIAGLHLRVEFKIVLTPEVLHFLNVITKK